MSIRGSHLHVVPELEQAMEEPSADAAHLTRVLETLPVCLMRVGTDGVLLAANQAALGLLGVDELADALGTVLTERITPKDQPAWLDFTRRIAHGTSSSIECELSEPAGTVRPISLQGAPLLDHPDQTPSIVLIARDASSGKVLEHAVLSQDQSAELGALRTTVAAQRVELDDRAAAQRRLEQSLADAQRAAQSTSGEREQMAALRAELDERSTAQQRLEAALAASKAAQQTLAEQHQLASLTTQREVRELAAKLDAAAAAHAGEKAALEGSHRAAIEQLHAEFEAQRHGTESEVVGTLRAQVDALTAERQQLADLAAERGRQQQAIADAHALERSELQQRLDQLAQEAAQRDADAARRDHDWALRAQHAEERLQEAEHRAEAAAARLLETAAREQDEARRSQEIAAREQAAVRRAQEAAGELAAARGQLEETRLELRQLQASLAQAQTDRDALDASYRARLESLLAECAAERQAGEEQLLRTRQLQGALADLQAAHQEMAAAHSAALEQLRAEHDAVRQRTEEELTRTLRAEVSELEVERQRLMDIVAQQAAQHEALAAAHVCDRADLQQRLVNQEQAAVAQQRQLAAAEDQAARRVAALEAELEHALASQQAVVDRLHDIEAVERRRAEQSATERAHTEEALLASAQRQEQLAKALADSRIELDALSEQLRQTETMVAAAWLAAGAGRELQRYVVAIETRTKYLLGQSSLEAGSRSDVEALRADAIRAASLARQITRPVAAAAPAFASALAAAAPEGKTDATLDRVDAKLQDMDAPMTKTTPQTRMDT